MERARFERPDGRYLLLYAFDQPAPPVLDIDGPSRADDRIELRYNPLLGEQVIVSTGRQERTFLPPDEQCPLCPTRADAAAATEIPATSFEIAVFENRFPSFRPDAPPAGNDSSLERRARAEGVCEVVVYTADHEASLGSLSGAQVRRLVDVWAERYGELSAREDVRYVFAFENRGKEIGVTLTHPHGQIYAFPFVPPRVQQEQAAALIHERANGTCLLCDLVAQEVAHGRRIVAEAPGFVAFVPFAARLPYEVHVVATAHRESLIDLRDSERDGLGAILRDVQRTYDALWGFPMPYTMSMHQRAADGVSRPGEHLHVEFAPPHRTRDKLKYLAGVETGAGAFINDTSPEEKAAELREARTRAGVDDRSDAGG
jgi:UDPglucose--hexose-1-phosphate uridylyltransferase